ncbi:MAG: stage III sporulation protein AB [Eubacteriales bacterium]
MILMTGTLYGRSKGRVYQKRYLELQEWKRIFTLILSEVMYGGATIIEVIRNIKIQCRAEQFAILDVLETNMNTYQKKRFAMVWLDALKLYSEKSMLNEQDISALERVGSTLGSVDREKQISMIHLYLEQVEQTLVDLEKEKDDKTKLCNTLGLLGSIFIIILLI